MSSGLQQRCFGDFLDSLVASGDRSPVSAGSVGGVLSITGGCVAGAAGSVAGVADPVVSADT